MSDDSNRPLRILIMAAETVPFAKSGEVAEVIGALAKALYKLGHDARIAMPRYNYIDAQRFGLNGCMESFPVPMDNHWEMAHPYCAAVGDQVPVYLIDNPRYFGRNTPYMHVDDAERFIFYARATLEMLKHPQLAWQPDVIHCHDWQTAVVPNWLATIYKDDPFFAHTATVFTIHRLAHQGIFGYRVLELAGLEDYGFLYHPQIGELADLVDLVARGIYYADAINTVSECYAQEILTPEYGERLDPLLSERRDRLYGVLNGIDTEAFNPSTDPHIASRYDVSSLERRVANKTALQRAFGLQEDPDAPLIGMIARLNDTKGLGLVTSVLDIMMAHLDVQFLALGIGDQKYHDALKQHTRQHPGRMGLYLGFDDALERLIYAGSDMFLMPSYVEPCGLGQMIAMRYGSVPIVRATGGLADTVCNYEPGGCTGCGFSFRAYDAMALYTAIVRAVEVYKHRELWFSLQQRCMKSDFSWMASAAKYVDIYRRAQANRARAIVAGQ